jgi:DNA-binding phage protein
MSKTNGKRRAGETLAHNLETLMRTDRKLSSGPKVAKAAGISRKSVNNMAENRHDSKLSSIEAVGKSFGLEVYQLLLPGLDENLLALYRAYSETDEHGKNQLRMAAEIVNKTRERTRKSGTNE